MIAWMSKHLLWLAGGAAFAYWFFTGSDPIMLARAFTGQGRKLTRHHLDRDGNVLEDITDLVAEASSQAGHAVSEEAYLLASVSASEHWDAGPKEKALIQRVMLNRLAAGGFGGELWSVVTGGNGMGKQAGRPCSTVNGPWGLDLELAEANLAGELQDDSHGAKYFVHKTGFRTVTDYQDVCESWERKHGIVPVDVGGVSSLRIFLPKAEA
jgi:hypothetical protein